MTATFKCIVKNRKTFETFEYTYATAIVLSTLGTYHQLQVTYFTDSSLTTSGNTTFDYDDYNVYIVR